MERFLRTEKETLKLRLIAALGAAVGLYVHQQQLSLVWLLILPLTYGIYVAYSLALRYYLLPRFGATYLIYGMIAVDAAALTGIVYVIGGINSVLLILFPVFIIYYSIHLGYVGSFVTATTETLGLGSYVLFASPEPVSERGLAMAIAMLYITAIFSGYLGQRGIRAEAAKEELQEILNVERGAKSLLEVAKTLTSTLELEPLLQDITRLAPGITGLSKCVAMLLDQRGVKLEGKAANMDVQELGLKQIRELVEALEERSLARQAFVTGLPVAVSNPKEDLGELLPPPPELRAESLLAIPLLSQGTPLGIIYSYEDTGGHIFTEGELRLAKGFGDLTSIAIANANLYQEAQAKIDALVAELGATVQRIEKMREPRRRTVISVDGLVIDTSAQKVTLLGTIIELSPTEFRLLNALADNAGAPVSQELLFRRTWGDVYQGHTNAVDVYIHRLRRKLEENASVPKRIVTVRGIGYKLTNES